MSDRELADAIRMSKTIMVYDKEDEGLIARGVIMAYDKETVTLLEYSVGVVHVIRENVVIVLLDEPVQ